MDHNRTFLLRLGFVSAVKRSSFTDINKDGDVLKIMDQADEMYLKLSSPSSTNN